jgi:hypothetical protein
MALHIKQARAAGGEEKQREAHVNWLIVLIILGVALISAGAVALGMWLNQRGTEAFAQHTLAGQRVLARDAALREWRRQQSAPYIDAANMRMRLWLELLEVLGGLGNADETRRQELMQQLLEVVQFNILVVRRFEIRDDAFRKAVLRFVEAEGRLKERFTKEEVMDVFTRLTPAFAQLNQEAERYILG